MFDKATIEELKRRVPSIPDIVTMSQESANSLNGPCPKCNGDDRFVCKTDSGKAFCRQCHPGAMDNLDFQKWHYGKSIKDLLKEYMPEYNPNQVQNLDPVQPLKESQAEKSQEQTRQGENPDMQVEWGLVLSLNSSDKSVKDFLCGQRNISEEEVTKIFDVELVRVKQYHNKNTLAFAYKTLDGKALAIQILTLDGKPFPFTEKYSDPTNKIFLKGSKPGQACFFFCGASHEDAEKIFIYESIINALTGAQCYPKGCHIALGGSTYLKKLKDLKPHTKHTKDFILCFDNDPAGRAAMEKAAIILGARSRTIQWPKCYRQGHDINDKLKAGDIRGIVDLLINAVKVEVGKAEKEKESPAQLRKEYIENEQGEEPGIPFFVDGTAQLRVDTQNAWIAIMAKNDPPVMFENSMGVVSVQAKLRQSEKLFIKIATPNSLRHRLSNIAIWKKERNTKEGVEWVDAPPPKVLCENMLEDISPLPFLKGIKNSPFYTKEGILHKEPGYSKESQWILEVSPGLGVPGIVDNPSFEDIKQARLLCYELVENFPFTTQAERAHAIVLMFLPFVREMILGPVPLHLVSASTPGTGKTLLVMVLTYIFLGQDVPTMTEAKSDAEWLKKITAKLINFPAFIFVDNAHDKIDSAVLAAALTSLFWEDRILGKTEIINIPITCGFIVTGNNPSMSSEMARRTIQIRLDALLDRPWDRGKECFKHPDLLGWVKKYRGELIGAVLTLIQAWIAKGCPAAKGKRLGSFEAWSNVMGGILEVAGIPGFLENMNDFYENADAEGSVLRSLISAWYRTFGGAEIGVSDIFHIVIKNEIPVDIGEKSERSQKTKLGQLLRQLKGRRFTIETEGEDGGKENSSFQVTAGKISHSAQQWKLTYEPMVPNKNIEKGEPQNIGSPISSPLKLVDFTGKGERGEPGEPKLNPIRAHVHTRTCARTQENSVEGGKGSPSSPSSQNLINLDSYKGEPMGEPQEIGSPFMNDNNDEVVI